MAPKGKQANKGTSSKVLLPRVDSSAPTALLAPDDYEHLYAAGKGKGKAVKVVKGQSDSLADAGNSDAPTALIAPQDYAHIFCAEPTFKKKVPPKNANDKRIPSDAPTALINEITKQQKAKSTVGKPAAQDTKAKGQKPKAADGGSRRQASSKPTASKAACSSSRMESSYKHENEDGEEEGSGCACLII